MRSDPVSRSDHRSGVHGLIRREHPELELWAVSVEPFHERLANRLDDEVDVAGLTIGVHPEARVDLGGWISCFRRRQLDGAGDKRERRPEVGYLARIDLAEMDHVASRLHDHRPDAERPDAMFNHPAADRRDSPAGNAFGMLDEVTCHAAHVRQRRAVSLDDLRCHRGLYGSRRAIS